ncbi:hypothetical protein [Gemmata sp.]|uniref:hypothetical protein n=1 Tax=Gemmata sp. TaxID=1914242 RepID=UPI003F7273F6
MNPRIALSLLLVAPLAGCGEPAGDHNPITGEVRLDGEPLHAGTVMFRPADGVKGQAVFAAVANGRYTVPAAAGPAVGPHRVEVRGLKRSGKAVQKPLAPKGDTAEEMVEAVAAKFNTRSELTVEVKPGENVADFEVTSK